MGKILIIADLRGKLLETHLKPPNGYTIEFEIKNGATLNEAKNIAWRKLTNIKYECVYMMAGICSVTSKEEYTIYLPFDTKEEIVEGTIWNVRTTIKELDDSFTTPIVQCTFPGIDLIRANNKHATGDHPQQNILNEAMVEINKFIVDHNLNRGFSTPMLLAAIHRCHKKDQKGIKRYRHHYCRLADGIHPTEATLKYWAKRFEEDFAQFTFNFEDL